MRKILFRGKRVANGEWVEGFYEETYTYDTEKKVHRILWVDEPTKTAFLTDIIPETLCEFTGLYDKNGNRIWENDICRFREWSKGDMCWIGKVHYEHCQFVISGDHNKECESQFLLVMSRFIPENIEVIGNRFDNPELLTAERSDNENQ